MAKISIPLVGPSKDAQGKMKKGNRFPKKI